MTVDESFLVEKLSNRYPNDRSMLKTALELFGLKDVHLEDYKVVDFDDEATQYIYIGTATYNGKKVHVVVKWGDAGAWFALFDSELGAKHYAEIVDFGWDAEECDVDVVFFTEMALCLAFCDKEYAKESLPKVLEELSQEAKVHEGVPA